MPEWTETIRLACVNSSSSDPLDLPQVTETNTPRLVDAAGE